VKLCGENRISTHSGHEIAAAHAEFARAAQGRSALYVELANSVAGDGELLGRIAALPLEKQQPNLLFGAMKYLFGPADGWPHFRSLARTHWPEVESVMRARRTQTNEPARCATLLPVLAGLPQPLALLEVGASAGLCLLPDKYAHDYGRAKIPPTKPDTDAPIFRCAADAATPIPTRNIEVVWRAGMDLEPLDVANDDDMRWLKALVWPDEGDRETLLAKAIAIARADPPRLVQGDLRRGLAALAAEAPKEATLVIYHSAVLNYVRDPAERAQFAECVRATGARWIANEGQDVFFPGNKRSWPAGSYFILTLDGKPLARTESHGASIEWLA
jgi:hypothetical protein